MITKDERKHYAKLFCELQGLEYQSFDDFQVYAKKTVDGSEYNANMIWFGVENVLRDAGAFDRYYHPNQAHDNKNIRGIMSLLAICYNEIESDEEKAKRLCSRT